MLKEMLVGKLERSPDYSKQEYIPNRYDVGDIELLTIFDQYEGKNIRITIEELIADKAVL